MLHEFMVWSESKMREKGETHSADHMLSLLAMIEGLSQEFAMNMMRDELHRLKLMMRAENDSVAHGVLWSNMLNVEQSMRGGNGELWFADHVPGEK